MKKVFTEEVIPGGGRLGIVQIVTMGGRPLATDGEWTECAGDLLMQSETFPRRRVLEAKKKRKPTRKRTNL
jgi:hypothetical protein